MKKNYIIKPFDKNKPISNSDKEKRIKVEQSINKKLTDWEWLQYKKMILGL